MRDFLLGTHLSAWLSNDAIPDGISLFVSHRRLDGGSKGARKSAYPRARHDWALDSGGFSELSMYGQWRTTPQQYVTSVLRYTAEIGRLQWAAPQDWMCEPWIIAKTGLSVEEHQRRTVANFIELRALWAAQTDLPCPFMPVLQGYTLADYLTCWDLYDAAGIELAGYPVVGVGSVCRRQSSIEIAEIMWALLDRDPELQIHGFGVKGDGLSQYGDALATADSMGWSFNARKNEPLPQCRGLHKNCANCADYALAWMRRMLARPTVPVQRSLFAFAGSTR